MAKQPPLSSNETAAILKNSRTRTRAPVTGDASVRLRRAYFDCRFGQLHVRTAFPTTGGFDEGVTLVCIHPADGTSRMFTHFLPAIAADRSVYAPDLPGCGESDPSPGLTVGNAAHSIRDLAAGLRLRQIDLLGVRFGAGAALELGAAAPDLVRRLVLIAPPPLDRPISAPQECLVLRPTVADARPSTPSLVNVKYLDWPDAADPFEAAPKQLAAQIGAYLSG